MHHKISYMCLPRLSSLLCFTGPGTFHSMPSQSLPMTAYTRVHILLQSLVKTCLDSLIYPEMTVIPSWFWVAAYLLVLLLFWVAGLHLARRLLHQIWNADTPEKTSFSLHLKLAHLHIIRTLSNIS